MLTTRPSPLGKFLSLQIHKNVLSLNKHLYSVTIILYRGYNTDDKIAQGAHCIKAHEKAFTFRDKSKTFVGKCTISIKHSKFIKNLPVRVFAFLRRTTW